MPSKSLLIVWHSRTGASRQMAACAAKAAAEAQPDIDVTMVRADCAVARHILAADAYLFVCPENLGTMSGQMKEFFDRNYYDCMDQLNGRAYGCIVCAGSDGQGAARQITRIVTGWRLKAVVHPLIINTDAQTAETIQMEKLLKDPQLQLARDLGAGLAAGLAIGIY